MRIALTRAVSPTIDHAELTHVARVRIDLARAEEQHAAYERMLEELGCTVRRIDPAPAMPDAVFVEDTAIVVDELAIITRPGAESRRNEIASMAAVLGDYRPLAYISEPATIDGGDVLHIGKRLWVGESARSSSDAVRQLRALLPGYTIASVPLRDALHLKTAVTYAGNNTLIINPAWVDPLEGFDIIDVDPSEPFAANVLTIGTTVVCSAAFPRTAQRLRERGFDVREIDASELAKAEGGLTCCSVIVDQS
jgi:dimethylargininase